MPRPVRINLPNLIYHVVNRGNNKQVVFVEESDYQKYLDILRRYKIKFGFKIFAYCLMSNHIHLLIKTSEKGTISAIMKAITIAHTRNYHFKYNCSGHIWGGRFKSPIVSDDEYLLTVMRYIEQSPVRAGIVVDPEQYRFSSYQGNVKIELNNLVDKEENPVYSGFGNTAEERASRYKEFVTKVLEEDNLKLIRKSLNGEGYFISEKFQAQIKERLALKEKRPRGRPSRTDN